MHEVIQQIPELINRHIRSCIDTARLTIINRFKRIDVFDFFHWFFLSCYEAKI